MLPLLLGTVWMLAWSLSGLSEPATAASGFAMGLCGLAFILYEIFTGAAGQAAANSNKVNRHVQASFQTMRFIVTIGWSIYPLGYLFGYLMGSVGESPLNATYNLADFVNKIAFCLAIWASAKNSTLENH